MYGYITLWSTIGVLLGILNLVHGQNTEFVDCGGELNQQAGTITSPNFPDYYPNNARCYWTITTAENQVIDFRFSFLQLERWYRVNACADTLYLYDGPTQEHPLLAGPLCGQESVSSIRIRTTGHQLLVVFSSNGIIAELGFSAYFWSHECSDWTYGRDECNNTCPCIQANTQTCDNQDGTCTCKEGWTAVDCSEDVDECNTITDACPEDLTVCRNTPGGYGCDCEEGLVKNSADVCEDAKRCTQKTCSHACGLTSAQTEQCYCPRGMKLNTLGGLTCVACDDNHFGRDCAKICDCKTNNTEYCDKVNGRCHCKPQWTALRCDQDLDECEIPETSPCDPTNSLCYNTHGSFECRCDSGYEKITETKCEECGRILTESDGSLTSTAYHSNGFADCFWTIQVEKGQIITIDLHVIRNDWFINTFVHIYDGVDSNSNLLGSFGALNKPDPNVAIHSTSNQVYIVRDSSFDAEFALTYWSHACPEFMYGANCSSACQCTRATTDFCNSMTGQCACKNGWTSADCSVDLDECSVNPLACPDYTNCINLVGSFDCTCKPGLIQDSNGQCIVPSGNPECTDEECLHLCTDSTLPNQGEVCHCPIGMVYNGKKCVACTNMTYGPDCSHVCSCVPDHTAACDHRTGACQCLSQWTGENCSEDEDECVKETHECQPLPIAECVNTEGGYECKCQEENGYKNDGSGKCVPNECHWTLTESSGIITSPNYPGVYFNNANCSWSITVEKESVISVWFLNFNMEFHQDCDNDYVELYDGPTQAARLIGRYCGGDVPTISAQPTTNSLFVMFVTDASVTDYGFRVSYASHKCPEFMYGTNCSSSCQCARETTDYCNIRTGQCICKNGWTSADCSVDRDECSENPLACPDYTNCGNLIGGFECLCKQGLVQNSNGQCVAPSGNSDCTDKDCLHLCVDTTLQSQAYAAEVCHCPIGMLYNGNKCVACTNMTYGPDCSHMCSCVPHHTAECNHRTGACQCLNGWTGETCSQDIDECALKTHECQSEPFSECINTAGSYMCRCREDNGYISDGNGRCVPIVCSGTLTEPSGIFTSPNYPNFYFNFANCSWLITVAQDNVVSITFSDFDIENHQSCYYDSIKLYDGPTHVAPLIGRFCGEVAPNAITTTTNSLFVQFVTDSGETRRGFRASYTSQKKQN